MMRSIIVDDEPRAIKLLEDYITRYGNLDLLNTFRNPLNALQFIQENEVDLIFLDIDMPGLSGLALAELLPERIQIIFSTAYAEHAVKSYDLQATDYLLKPIAFDRFIKAVQRARSGSARPLPSSDTESARIISLKSGFDIHRVAVNEILYLEKDGNYMTYYLPNKKIVVRQSTKEALKLLTNQLIQIHKSYLVAIKHISLIDKDGLHINNRLLPVGSKYRKELMRLIH